MTIRAKYEHGVFKPIEDVSLTEGAVVEVHLPSNAEGRGHKRPSVADSAFFGMWKDRTDIGDSVEYVNNLRRAPRT